MPLDVEALVITWLAPRVEARVVNELPSAFEKHLPILRVTGLPGPKSNVPWNGSQPLVWTPRVDIDVYAASRADATDLATLVSRHLYDLRNQHTTWGFVANVDETAGPAWRPEDNTNVRRSGLTTALTVRAA